MRPVRPSPASEFSLPSPRRSLPNIQVQRSEPLTTCHWEDESTDILQLNIGEGHILSRRIVDDFVNGTKLLNATKLLGRSLTRGRRDGVLKSERRKLIIRKGCHDFRGVWYVAFYSNCSIMGSDGNADTE